MFKVNDKVLCYHGPFLYEATVHLRYHNCSNEQVLEAENKSGKGTDGVGPHYKVHYKGWKRTYVPCPSPLQSCELIFWV